MPAKNRWTPSEAVRIARALLSMVEQNLADLADRNMNDEFVRATRETADATEAASAGQPVRLGQQKGTTEALSQVLARINRRVSAAREALRRNLPERKDLHKAAGIGELYGHNTVGQALASVDAVLELATTYPTEVAAASILERDITALRDLRTALLTADASQEDAKGSKKAGTAIRDAITYDLIRRIDRILAAAALEYAEDDEKRDAFYAVLPTKKKAPKSKPTN